jgi:tRNA pseudouridine38-40 synthase
MNNYKLTIQYDGTNYSGWQIQNNAITVQQKITETVKTIIKEEINLIGSGRTDAGVHAWGQVGNFRTEQELDLFKLKFSMNSILPSDISILQIEKVNEDFHARFDAKKRSYIYLISSHKSPFFNKYSYFYPQTIDCSKLNLLSKIFLHESDFSAFCKKANEAEGIDCFIYDIYWRETRDLIYFYVEANRFLRGMVRALVGTLLNVYKDGDDEERIKEIISSRSREQAGESVPPQGLFLFRVTY